MEKIFRRKIYDEMLAWKAEDKDAYCRNGY